MKIWKARTCCGFNANGKDAYENATWLLEADDIARALRAALDVAESRARCGDTLISVEVLSVVAMTLPIKLSANEVA